MATNERSMKMTHMLRRFIPYYGKYKAMLVFDLFCAAMTTVCELVLPLIVRNITTLASNDLAALTAAYVLKLGGIYVILRVIDSFANFYMSARGHIMGHLYRA